jgi:REP-associated tyrosine transposase
LNCSCRNRRSIRLRGYDYSLAGAYFVTVCVRKQEFLFGDVVEGEMRLNDAGWIVQATWDGLPSHYAGVRIDAFVIMPNHVHGIIVLTERDVGAGFKPAPTDECRRHGLSEIVRGFKTFSSRRINELHETPGVSVWQRNYYEHIIRNDDSMNRIRKYIVDNPARWAFDRENPAVVIK